MIPTAIRYPGIDPKLQKSHGKITTRQIHMCTCGSLLYGFQLAETRHTFWCFWFVRAWESWWCSLPGTSGRGGAGPRADASWGRTGTAGSPAALHKYQSQNILVKGSEHRVGKGRGEIAASWGRTGTAGSPAALHKYRHQQCCESGLDPYPGGQK